VTKREGKADATHLGIGDPGVDGLQPRSRHAVELTMYTTTPTTRTSVPARIQLVIRAGHRWN
jgi:hypothetical protein